MNPQEDEPLPNVPGDSAIGDRNVEQLLGRAYQPETVAPGFAQRIEAAMCSVAREASEARVQVRPQIPLARRSNVQWTRLAWSAVAATILVAVGFVAGHQSGRLSSDGLARGNVDLKQPWEMPAQRVDEAARSEKGTAASDAATTESLDTLVGDQGLTPRPRPPVAAVEAATVGENLVTESGQRRRVTLADGSVLSLNERTQVTIDAERHITLGSGEVYVEVSPRNAAVSSVAPVPAQTSAKPPAENSSTFLVRAAGREIAALGTKFAVRADDDGANVYVTQGKVQVSDVAQPIMAGQQWVAQNRPTVSPVSPLPRASAVLDWTRDLVAATESPLVPASLHSGGSIVARDPNGQEARLSLRKYHIDVYMEDGFARTTIDQTYFNHTSWRLEGTFHFPLPPDASLSRLAMYVDGKLMEGGMAERDYAREVFDKIVRTQKDPALLEWVDGSTFKMRVFPLEARQEKRIILSYTQRLEGLYGHSKYRFPAGHSLEAVRDWSLHARVKNGAEMTWSCQSHELKQSKDGNDLLLDAQANEVKLDRDVVLRFTDRNFDVGRPAKLARFSETSHDGQRYLMLRYRPELPSKLQRQRRDWVFLFESSGDRDPVLARVQADVIKTLLENTEHDDTFAILTAGTQVRTFENQLVPATPQNVKRAVEFLNGVHLAGALDLGQALDATEAFVKASKNPFIVHVGSGTPVLGERAEDKLLKKIPAGVHYVGVGVGKRWSRQFMKTAASRTAGYFTQINPDESIAWRAFELYSTLNTPRLLAISVVDHAERARFLCYEDSIAHGEELCAMARLGVAEPLPEKLIVSGTLDGEPFRREIALESVADKADYIPRTWAKLRIDQLLAEEPTRHRDEIISLSKAMYVMSPFTSLLVLESEPMYIQFNVDRGRSDHWAMYNCPPQIPIVYEPERLGPDATRESGLVATESAKSPQPTTILLRLPPESISRPSMATYYGLGGTYMQLLVCPDDDSTSPSEARGDESRRLGLDSRRNYYRFRRGEAKQDDLSSSNLFSLALPNRGAWSSESDVKQYFEFSDALGQLVRGDGGQAAAVRGHSMLLDLYAGDSEWKYRWGLDAVPLMDRAYFSGGWRATEGLFPKAHVQFDGLASFYLDGHVPYGNEPRFGADATRRLRTLSPLVNQGVPSLSTMSDAAAVIAPRFKVLVQQLESGQQRLQEQEVRLYKSLSEVDESSLLLGKLWYERVDHLADSVIRNKLRVYPGQAVDTHYLRRSEANQRKSELFLTDPYRNIEDRTLLSYSLGDLIVGEKIRGGWANPDPSFSAFRMSDDFAWAIPWGRVMRSRTLANGRQEGFVVQPLRGTADSLTYDRPKFMDEARAFADVTSYARGFYVSLNDVLALLDSAETTDAQRKAGEIDPAARALIEKAREAPWQTITYTAQYGHSVLTVDGKGRFVSQSTTMAGLQEQVIADGSTMWHLYPELGIGTRRSFSRFHRTELQSLVPWLLPSAEELARGANLRAIGDRTVEVVSRWAEDAQDADGNPVEYVALHLVFANDGRLLERRLLKLPSGGLLAREIYEADGAVRWFGDDGKLIGERKLSIEPAIEPNLKPDLKDLVVLPMPARASEHVFASTGRPRDGRFDEWSEDEALQLLAADLLENTPEATQIIGQRFFAKGDRRVGFYTLLLSSGATWDPQTEQAMNNSTHVRFDPVADHPHSALAKYIFLHEQQMTKSGKIEEMDLATQQVAGEPHRTPSSRGGERGNAFVQQLAEFRDLFARYERAKALESGDAQHTADRQKALAFVRRTNSPFFGWAVLSLFKDRDAGPEDHRAWAESSLTFEKVPALAYAARYEAARSHARAGDWQRARELFGDLHTRTLKQGILPPIDESFHQAFHNGGSDGPDQEKRLFREGAESLLATKARSAIFALAWQCHHIGERQLADELFATAVAGMGDDERASTTLTAVAYLAATEQYARADALLQPLLDGDALGKVPSLWRLGASLAEKHGMTARSVACLDRALDIEYQHLPEDVDLEAVRAEFGKLLTRYQQLADSIATLPGEPAKEILGHVVRAADRWRSLDPDDTPACEAAARVLVRLGASDTAWEYATTPFSDKPGEPPSWLHLGQTLRDQGAPGLAELAYELALAAEPGNAQILWERAQMLEQAGKPDAARQCYRRIAEGQWDASFQSIQTQARQAIGEISDR